MHSKHCLRFAFCPAIIGNQSEMDISPVKQIVHYFDMNGKQIFFVGIKSDTRKSGNAQFVEKLVFNRRTYRKRISAKPGVVETNTKRPPTVGTQRSEIMKMYVVSPRTVIKFVNNSGAQSYFVARLAV